MSDLKPDSKKFIASIPLFGKVTGLATELEKMFVKEYKHG
jgi:hypothetical protein